MSVWVSKIAKKPSYGRYLNAPQLLCSTGPKFFIVNFELILRKMLAVIVQSLCVVNIKHKFFQ